MTGNPGATCLAQLVIVLPLHSSSCNYIHQRTTTYNYGQLLTSRRNI